MPLVRYRTGDLSRFIPEPCPCGTVLKRLEWVKGRLRGGVRLGSGHVLSVADLDEGLFPLPGLLNFRTEIKGGETTDSLHVTIYTGEQSGDRMRREALLAISEVPAVRDAVAEGALTLAPISLSNENWLSTGSIKRKIIDCREES
jgi:phenylacetate-coenzyme A ligase PaaK-like adenylate-forming protein